MAKKILVIQTAFIGDAILGSSILVELKKLYPLAQIDYLVRQGNEGLFQGLNIINRIWIWEKKRNKWFNLLRLAKEINHEGYDLCVNLHRHFTSGFFTIMTGAQDKIGFKENPLSFFYSQKLSHHIPYLKEKVPWQEVQRNAELLTLINSQYQVPAATSLRPVLAVEEKHLRKVEAYQKRDYVVLAPASVWFTKQWPWEHFQKLVSLLADHFKVYLVGGLSDFELAEKVRHQNDRVENLCGKLNLLESAALMKKAHRVIVNDSGPLHLASAMNAPTVALFCSTIKEFGYYPLSDKSWVFETKEKLDCRPCGLHGKTCCPLDHFKCGYTITPEDVFKSIVL